MNNYFRLKRNNRYIALLIVVWFFFALAEPVALWGIQLLQDFNIYLRALGQAQIGQNPYFPFNIGDGFLYHPAVLTVLAPFGALPFPLAGLIWTAASIGAYVLALRLLRPTWQSAFILLLCFGPVWEMIIAGQVNAWMLLGLTLTILWSQQGKQVWAGIALACICIFKPTPVILLLAFAYQRQWRGIVACGLTFLVLTLVAALHWGPGIVPAYIETVFLTSTAQSHTLWNQSLIAALQRLLPDSGRWLAPIAAVVGAVLIALNARRRSVEWLFAALLTLAVLASPIVWYHHYVLLLPAILYVARTNPRLGAIVLILIQCNRLFLWQLPNESLIITHVAQLLMVYALFAPVKVPQRLSGRLSLHEQPLTPETPVT